MKRIVFFLLTSLSIARAQVADSTLLLMSNAEEEKLSIRNSSKAKDTVIDNQFNYYDMGVLGNTGLPSYSLLVKEQPAHSGFFKWMNLNNESDLFTTHKPVYFYPQGKIYTKVFAAMGQKQEQVFKLLHSQNIKRVNISLAFNRYSCFGFYLNQKSLTDNFLLSSHGSTKKGRAGYTFYFLLNKLKYQLNGGIDTAKANFENNILVQKQLFPVMLSATRQNIRTSEVNFKTFLRLNGDSSSVSHFIEYEGNYQSNYWMNFEGLADTGRYANNYFYSNSGTNKDSIAYHSLQNGLSYRISSSDRFLLYLGYKNEVNQYRQFSTDTATMNHIATAGFKFQTLEFLLGTNGQYVLNGFNAGNYFLSLYNRVDASVFYISADVTMSKLMPSFMSVSYFSPHFIWSDTLSDISTISGNAKLGSDKYRFSLGLVISHQSDPVYFDTLALPKQYAGTTLVNRFFLQKDLKLGPIHFNNVLNYQKTANSDIIRLPELYTSHQLYYEGKLFKKALWLQVGVQARYISAFKANAYMPATNQFYLQNQREYGNYVFADLFINAQIERFRFFVLASHINQGLSGSNYMLSPNYAMPDRSIKAGLTWMFFD